MLKAAVLSFVAAAAIAAWPTSLASDSRTIEDIINGEKRYVLYNSRRLTGECLPICEDPELPSPTGAPTGIEGAATQTPTGSSTVTTTVTTTGSSTTSSPTASPTRFEEGLTPPPTGNPTGTPTGSPTGTPTGTPTGSPTGSPTGTPTGTPTGVPTGSPTGTPTGVPTGTPTGDPTGTPVPPPSGAPQYECKWPSFLHRYTGITKGDFTSSAHTIAYDLAVEGTFSSPNKDTTISPAGKIWYGRIGSGLFNWNGKQKIDSLADVDPPIDYAHFEWLARNIENSDSGKYRVRVFTSGREGTGAGGCYTLKDLRPEEAAQSDGKVTLAVFNTSDDICLETNSGNGRAFGPSVLAPFSKVTLKSNYLDGVFIAKNFVCNNSGAQLHGLGFEGEVRCVDEGNPPAGSPNPPPADTPVESPTLNCDMMLANLGHGFSEATGRNAYDGKGCWPQINEIPNNHGRDDSVNLFVGGNAVVGPAVEAEGKIVIMGDFKNKGSGWEWVTAVGAGYQVLPNDYSNCLVVGGDVSTGVNVKVGGGDHNYQKVKCNMVYGTSKDGSISRFSPVGGSKKTVSQSNEDMDHYREMTEVWYAKSKYWSNLYGNGLIDADGRYLMFSCPTNKDTTVFYLEPSMLNGFDKISFTGSCADKTLLVNVKGTGNIKIRAIEILPMSNMQRSRECTIAKNLLWNFPDAAHVEIGDGGTDEWVGATLVTGNLKHHTSGFSGRVIVLGDLEHYGTSGSEFHAMEYNPPKPLPDPYCEDYSFGGQPPAPASSPVKLPVADPTEQPVKAPTPTLPPTEQPVQEQGNNVWGGGYCLFEWTHCTGRENDPNACCDGLYCHKYGWGSQCLEDTKNSCKVEERDCTNSRNSCCKGLKCEGDKWYAKCVR